MKFEFVWDDLTGRVKRVEIVPVSFEEQKVLGAVAEAVRARQAFPVLALGRFVRKEDDEV